MEILLLFFIFIVGLVVGSFLNVLIDRIPRGENIFTGRSHCEFCHHPLGGGDLIPLVSFMLLRGKCRYCHKKLSLYYMIIEIITGILFVFVVVYPLYSIPYVLFIISSLIVVFFTDLKYGIIPFPIVLPAIIIVSIYLFLSPNPDTLFTNFLAALGAGSFFFLLFLLTRKRGIGFGDVVYALLMGLLLGFPKIILGLYIAFLTGAAVSLILVVAKQKKLHGGTVPFGPFLVFGTVVSLFWGDLIINKILFYLL